MPCDLEADCRFAVLSMASSLSAMEPINTYLVHNNIVLIFVRMLLHGTRLSVVQPVHACWHAGCVRTYVCECVLVEIGVCMRLHKFPLVDRCMYVSVYSCVCTCPY